jgi:CubicO group peptidase (beta-lactamase class C family)
MDLMMEIPVRWGMGFALESPIFSNEYGHRVAYWGGNGGSLGFVDFDERMAVSYVMNRWIEGPYETQRNGRILKAAYGSLGTKKAVGVAG